MGSKTTNQIVNWINILADNWKLEANNSLKCDYFEVIYLSLVYLVKVAGVSRAQLCIFFKMSSV